MKLIFATANRHKIEEIQAILGADFTIVTPAEIGLTDEIPEDQATLEGNALQKARYIFDHTGMSCFADDTGLEVAALDGAPGVYSARYAAMAGRGQGHSSADNMALLLENMRGVDDRSARFRTVIALILPSEAGETPQEYLFQGAVDGQITATGSGHEGFGYDPIFRPDGYEQTFAQMPLALKNEISHRGRATARLAEFLVTQIDG